MAQDSLADQEASGCRPEAGGAGCTGSPARGAGRGNGCHGSHSGMRGLAPVPPCPPHVTLLGAGRNDFTLLPSPTCPVGHRPCTEYRDLRSRYVPAHLQRDGVPPLTSRPTADSLANEPLQALTWLSDGLNTITSRTTPGLLCLYLLRLRKRWSAMSYAATENPPVFFPTCHR